MASISGSNTFSVSSYSNKGMSGLVSGMDTEGLVQQMLAATQAKIDKQLALKQQTTWKQEIYRTLLKDINSFKSKYFDVLNPSTYLKSSSFFDAMKAATTSKAFAVTGTSGALTGDTSVIVEKLASAGKTLSGGSLSAGLIGNINPAALDKNVIMEVDGREVNVDLSGATDNAGIVDAINSAMTNNGISNMTASVSDTGILTFKGDKEVWVSGKSSALGLKMSGLTANKLSGSAMEEDENGIDQKVYSVSGKLDANPKVSIDVMLGGSMKTIELDSSKITTDASGAMSTETKDYLQSQFNKSFGNYNDGTNRVVVKDTGNGTFELESRDLEIRVAGDSIGLAALGFKSSQSTSLSSDLALKDLKFNGAKLQGDVFKFSINGKDFEFSKDTTLYQMRKTINNSNAGVKMQYDTTNDTYSIEATQSGAGFDVTMSQSEGNLLSVLFGTESGSKVTSGTLTSNQPLQGGAAADYPADGINGGNFSFTVNGQNYSIPLPGRTDDDGGGYSKEEITELLNRGLEKQFGFVTDANGDKVAAIQVGEAADGTFQMQANNGAVVAFSEQTSTDPDALKKDIAYQMGFNRQAQSNLATADMTMGELGLGTAADAGTRLSDWMIANPGYSFDAEKGRLTVDLTQMTDTSALGTATNEKLFGDSVISNGSGTGTTTSTTTSGQNAVVVINGDRIEQLSNTFTSGGLNFNLLEVSQKDADGNFIEDKVTTTRDNEQVFNGLKSFVEDYNKLIETLNKYTGEESTYKDYTPLTEAQKKDMSEREIANWEEKAKEGLLRNDSYVSSLVGDMRNILYTKPEDAKYALYDLGIETGGYKDQGKLVLDETKLKQMLDSDPEAIRQLFTDSKEGISNLLSKAIDFAANLSSGAPGSIVQVAGYKGYGSEKTNDLSFKLLGIQERIHQLNNQYEKERARYWSQFNTMEKILANFQSQSAWIGQQFG